MSDHCAKCGSNITPGARFCSGCGAIAVDPEMTRMATTKTINSAMIFAPDSRVPTISATVEIDSHEAERVVFTARPTSLFVRIGYAATALCSLLLIILLALADTPPLLSVCLGLALLLVPAFYHIRLNAIRYTLTDSKIEIDRGLFARMTRNIPLRNIQDVTVNASIAQRLLGIGNLVIDNASETGGKTVLANIRNPRRHADLLLRELRRWR